MNSTHFDSDPSNTSALPNNIPSFTNNDTKTGADSTDVIENATRIIRLLIPVYFAISLVGNTLSICVFTKRTFRKTSCGVYLLNLACFDILALMFYLLEVFVAGAHPELINNPVVCVLWRTCLQNTRRISNWTLVALTTDRMIAVLFPQRGITMCTPKRAVRVVIGLISVLTLTGIKNIWLIGVDKGVCVGYNPIYIDVVRKFVWFEVGIESIAPGALILILNVSVLVGLCKQHKELSSNNKECIPKNHQRDQQITRMLLFVTFFFLTTQIPQVLFRILKSIGVICPIVNTIHRRGVDCYLVKRVVQSIMMSNYAFNFVLYCLTGSKFRKELRRVFCSACRRETNNRKQPTSFSTKGEYVTS